MASLWNKRKRQGTIKRILWVSGASDLGFRAGGLREGLKERSNGQGLRGCSSFLRYPLHVRLLTHDAKAYMVPNSQ